MLKKIISNLFQALLFLWAGANFVMNWIGRSTIPDDAPVAYSLLEKIVLWFLSTPWWVPAILGVVAMVGSLWLLRDSRSNRDKNNKNLSSLPQEIHPQSTIETYLRLRIHADNRTPTKIEQNNIWRWYVLMEFIQMIKADNSAIERKGRTALFIVFDAPVNIGQIVVSSPDIKLPIHSVMDASPRHAIIHFNDKIEEGELLVTVRKP